MLSSNKLKYNMNRQNQLNIQEASEASPLINVRKLIDKPKDLIDKTTVNKIYPQSWGNKSNLVPTCSIITNMHQLRKLDGKVGENVMKCSTQLQYRNTSKPNARTRNSRFGKNKTLIENQESGELGKIIYERVPYKKNWDWKVKQLPERFQNIELEENSQETVCFDSRFESGNLSKAYKPINPPSNSLQTYYLITQNDTNTMGYNQWFYFRAMCNKPYENIRFQIINMRKSFSSFNKGMKIAILDEKDWVESKNGWHRAGSNIQYSCNQIKIFKQFPQFYYTLGWEHTFQSSNKWVYFAYSYPYTFTELRNMISIVKQNKVIDCQVTQLCLTPLKNELFLIKIGKPFYNQFEETNFEGKCKNRYTKKQIKFQFDEYHNFQKTITRNQHNTKEQQTIQSFDQQRKINEAYDLSTYQLSSFEQKTRQNVKKRQSKCKSLKKSGKKMKKDILLIMARAHPGQTPSSFVMQGVIQTLLAESINEVKYLKDRFWIHVIPMLNPDGVIHGNTRTSFTGNDLNRRWLRPHYVLHPQLLKVKQYIRDLIDNDHKIFAMVDCHGHTKKQSNFLYGCCDKNNYHNHSQVKLLNYLFAKADPNFNNSFSSHFVGESKKSTARVTFYRQFRCFSYTLQSSFVGPSEGSLHFSTIDYFNIGKNLLKSIAYFHASTTSKTLSWENKLYYSLLNSGVLKQAVLDHFDRHRRTRSISQAEAQTDKDSSGSSSSPSECNYDQKFLLQSIFESQTYNKQNPSRYKPRSRIKVGKRNLSLSISDKPSMSILGQLNKQKMASMKGHRMRSKIQLFTNKLPNLNVQTKEQQPYPSQFHAFNFKSRKNVSAIRKKKQVLDLDITIQ